jgi:hypothetical protein
MCQDVPSIKVMVETWVVVDLRTAVEHGDAGKSLGSSNYPRPHLQLTFEHCNL